MRWFLGGLIGLLIGAGLMFWFDPIKVQLLEENVALRKGAARLQTENAKLREELTQATKAASPPAPPIVKVVERPAAPRRDLAAVSREIFKTFERSGRAVAAAKVPEAERHLKPLRIEELPPDAQAVGETDGYTTFISPGAKRVYYQLRE